MILLLLIQLPKVERLFLEVVYLSLQVLDLSVLLHLELL